MKKVLLIATDFPPLSGTNIRRSLKLVKYLPRFNWEPIILTISTKGIELYDRSSLEDIPKTIKVYRAFWFNFFAFVNRKWVNKINKHNTSEYVLQKDNLIVRLFGYVCTILRRYLFIPDIFINWLPFALFKAIIICRKENIDLIYSTAPCYTNHLVGYCLKKITHKPWVTDYRDLWSDRPFRVYSTLFRKKVENRMDKIVLANSNSIVVVSEPMKNFLLKKHPWLISKKPIVIPSGFDSDDMSSDITCNGGQNKRLTIIYTGNLYIGQSAQLFLESLGQLMTSCSSFRRRVGVDFYGLIAADEKSKMLEIIKKYNMDENVRLKGVVSRKVAIEQQKKADILLLIIGQGINSDGIFTGKIFEYIEAKKFIFTVAADGVAAQLIKEGTCGLVVLPNDIEKIKSNLTFIVNRFFDGQLKYQPNWNYLERFNFKNLTFQLSTVFEDLVSQKSFKK